MGSSVWSLAALVLWLDGAGSPAPAPATPSSRSLTQLRDQARQVLQGSCGRCHDGTRPTAKPAALSRRFEGFGMPIPDRARVQAYIDAEIARRAESGAASAAVEPL
jgi:mono/diheme cytochrome c family protein